METNPDGSITADQLLKVMASLKEGDAIPFYVHFTGKVEKHAIRRILKKGYAHRIGDDIWWSTPTGKSKHMTLHGLNEPDTVIFLNFFHAYAHALKYKFPLPHDENG